MVEYIIVQSAIAIVKNNTRSPGSQSHNIEVFDSTSTFSDDL